MPKKHWLVKSEANCFPIGALAKCKNQTTHWDGVRNYQARNYMRDEMKLGDKVIFYHSNGEQPCAAGICEVVKEGYPDFTALDPEEMHYDPKSKEDSPTWIMVDIKLVKKFKREVTLAEIKENGKLQKMKLVQKANRLSVMPVTKEEFDEIVRLGNLSK
ncbi:MAG: EVE domain-containing protein [Ignavibacteriales bacterium]|nr:EVE domain-containing protein [Ignavibacteriales bacterium]